MTFPTIPTTGAGRIISAIQSNTTATRTFPALSGLTKNSGDLLIAIVCGYQSSTTDAQFSGWSDSFTEFYDTGTSTTLAIGMAYKWSTGSETAAITVTQAATITGNAVMILMSVAGAHASTIPEVGTRADGTTTAADPTGLNPSWDNQDTLAISVGACGETGTGGSYFGMSNSVRNTAPWAPTPPTNFSDGYATGCSSDIIGGNELAVGFRQINDAGGSVDSGAWAPDLSNARNSAVVVLVPPPFVTNAAATQAVVTVVASDATVDAVSAAVPPILPIMAPMVAP